MKFQKRQEELAALKSVDPRDIIRELNLTSRVDREASNYIRLHTPWRQDEHPSLVIFWGTRANCWVYKDMSEGWVGSNIDFWAKVKNTDYVTAVKEMREAFLCRSHTRPQVPQRQTQRQSGVQREKVEKVVPIKPEVKIIRVGPVRHPALIEYMQRRGIEKAPDWLKEVWWEERDRKFFALGVQDKNNNWHVRNSFVKRCIKTVRDKETTYALVKKGKQAVAVFEGLFDALTWHEANRRGCRWAVDTDLIVLNGVGNAEKLFRDGVLKQYRTVYLALDHDQNRARTGQKVSRMLVERLGFGKGNVVVVRLDGIYAAHKDLNSLWQEKYAGVEKRPEKEEKEKQQESLEIGF